MHRNLIYDTTRWYHKRVHEIGWYLKGCPNLGPLSMVQSVVINFSSKVYSKSLLKVWSLKRSIVYSLILDYQFCACIMRVSGIPQLQVIQMERLYGYKWHIMYDRWFTIALLTSGFGQVWTELGLKNAYNFRRDHTNAQLCSCRQRISWQVL